MEGELVSATIMTILPRLPQLLGILAVAGAAVWGLTRPRRAAGILALAGSCLAVLVWLAAGLLSIMPLWLLRSGGSLAPIGLITGTSSCVLALLNLLVWALLAAALVVAIRDQKAPDADE